MPYSTFALFGLGTTELVIIFLIVLLLFGGRKLPELARSAGTSVRELKKGLKEDAQEENQKQNGNKTQSGPTA